jgi:hypothetical protein
MALVNQQIPGLYNGVSQQAPEIRLDTQVEEMINCYPSVAHGVTKRNPTVLTATDNDIPEDPFIHIYDRGAGDEQYIIVIGDGVWRVYDENGAFVSNGVSSYLDLPTGVKASESFALVTVGDTTFVTNKTKEVAHTNVVNDNGDEDWKNKFFYWVKRTGGGSDSANQPLRYTYYIINQAEAMSGTATSGNTTGDLTDSTANFAGNLVGLTVNNNTQGWKCVIGSNTLTTIATSCNTNTWHVGDEYSISNEVTTHDSNEAARGLSQKVNSVGHPDYSATYKGSVVRIEYTGDNGIELLGSDSWGNQAHESWSGQVKNLADLPNELGYPGTVVEITGDEKSNFDNYYIKYEDGVYKETFKPGLSDGVLEATTMPHKFERQEDGSFTLSSIEWDARTVGDEDSSSVPSFVGQTIDDIFFFKNRLGLLSADNVILSETGEYYNFFPTTATDILDSDPIDVAVDSNQAVYLRYAIPFNKELLLFGDKAQFILSGSETLTPQTVSIQQSTAYNFNSKAAPVTLGPNVYFATDNGSSAIIREYFVVPDTAANDAANITAHCPSYIPKGVYKLTGSGESDMLFALSSESPNTIYVYNFYWQGNEKAQSAWHKWILDGTIFNIEVLNDVLLVMMEDGADRCLKSISLEVPADFTQTSYLEDGVNEYTSDIELTKWGVPGQQGIENTRGNLVLRDIKLEMEYGSLYWVESEKNAIPRVYSYITSSGALPSNGLLPGETILPGAVTYTMKSDHKYPIAGNVDNTILSIKNDTYAGFKLNSLNLRGMYKIKSRSI